MITHETMTTIIYVINYNPLFPFTRIISIYLLVISIKLQTYLPRMLQLNNIIYYVSSGHQAINGKQKQFIRVYLYGTPHTPTQKKCQLYSSKWHYYLFNRKTLYTKDSTFETLVKCIGIGINYKYNIYGIYLFVKVNHFNLK